MKAYIGVTDKNWFELLSSYKSLEEVNFWRPSASNTFRVLDPGELFLFKLHSPHDFIVGGGFFVHYSPLPITLAWEAFEKANGANSLPEMRERVGKYRREPVDPFDDYEIGCILLEKPFFLSRDKWIPVPADWKSNIVSGRSYDFSLEPGLSLYRNLHAVLSESLTVAEEPARYGEPIPVLPRLGQGTFRVLVTDVYQRQCAITRERTLPALEAAHIKPYAIGGSHEIKNGILFRKDYHALFDKGYLTITSQLNLEVSRRIKEEFKNGKEYYAHHGVKIFIPSESIYRPSIENLQWHNENVFKG